VTVGFGAKQSIDDSPLLPMLFASIGMAFATFLGVVIGHTDVLLVVIAALLGFGYGMLSTREAGYSWVGMQCVIFFLVASAFPASVEAAADRAALVLIGGTLQLFSAAILLRHFRQLFDHLTSLSRYLHEEETALRAAMSETAKSIRQLRILNSPVIYSLRVAATMALTTEIYRRLNFASGYWIPMTALLVLKPAIADTANRAIARVIGTFAGGVLTSFFVAHGHPSPVVLALCALLFAWLAYGTVNVNYALLSFCVTGYIVFLLSLSDIPSPVIAQRRTICTAIGGLIALIVRLLVISRRKKLWESATAANRQNA
jgi:uncharacterized membrane protein YccC